MASELSSDANRLKALLPADGTTRGNKSLRQELDWPEDRYWKAHANLVNAGYAQPGRGHGGSLRLLAGDKQALLSELPLDGAPVGNVRLKTKLGWSDDHYWRIRDLLLDDGVVARARGRGGALRRVLEPLEPASSTAQQKEQEYELEKHLYDPIVATLSRDWVKDERSSQALIEVTAHQGRRSTGGTWTRPDITMVSQSRFPLTNQIVFDVTTFEVKRSGDWGITAIYEAAAHNACASYSYAFFYEPNAQSILKQDAFDRCAREAARLGIGLIVATDPADYDQWDHVVDARRHSGAPRDLEEFLARQISEEGKTKIRSWWAFGGRSER